MANVFRDLSSFEAMRSLALTDIDAARMRLRLLGGSSGTRTVVRIYYGPPGTGKTLAAVKDATVLVDPLYKDKSYAECFVRFNELQGRVAFVTFHQSLQYEDVVESIRPLLTNALDEALTEVNDDSAAEAEQAADEESSTTSNLQYAVHEGVFLRMMRAALQNKNEEYVLVIDEINRGDISRILGPLITAIEADKRLGAEFPIGFELQYPRSTAETRMFMPANLHVIGTMNSADRNIALVDHALRRRFEFVETPPEPTLLNGAAGALSIDIRLLLEVINARIRYLLDADHQLGHGYLAACKTNENVVEVFARKIIPLLREYFYGNEAQLLLVLGETTTGEYRIFKQEHFADEAGFSKLFGVKLDAALEYGFRPKEQGVLLTIDSRFWNHMIVPARAGDLEFAVKALEKVYARGGNPAANNVTQAAGSTGTSSLAAPYPAAASLAEGTPTAAQ